MLKKVFSAALSAVLAFGMAASLPESETVHAEDELSKTDLSFHAGLFFQTSDWIGRNELDSGEGYGIFPSKSVYIHGNQNIDTDVDFTDVYVDGPGHYSISMNQVSGIVDISTDTEEDMTGREWSLCGNDDYTGEPRTFTMIGIATDLEDCTFDEDWDAGSYTIYYNDKPLVFKNVKLTIGDKEYNSYKTVYHQYNWPDESPIMNISLVNTYSSTREMYAIDDPAMPSPGDKITIDFDIEYDAHTHNYVSSVATEPTCTKPGVMEYNCECGAGYTETIPATGHSYKSEVIAPTCTENGYTLHTCTVCGDSYKDNETEATGHSYKSEVIAPTCTENGYTLHTCTVCGDSYKDSETKAKGHTYTSKITKAATCKEDGVKTYTCSCGDTYTETIAKTAHKYTTKVVAPTYTAQGYTLHTCSVCGTSYKDNYKAKLTRTSIAKAAVTGISNKVYTGKSIAPAPVVKLGTKTLKKGTDYTVTYKNNKNVGKATVTITGKGAYTGKITKTFKINPKATSITKLTSPKKKQLKATFKKVSGVTGYQVVYSTSKKFTKATTKTATVKTTSKTVKSLKKGKTYYVKVRTFKTVGGVKYYGAYSAVKKIKVK